LERVVEPDFYNFWLEAERAAKDLADFWQVEFPGYAFTGQDGVFAAVWPGALADASEGAILAWNDFMVAAAFPGTGNEIEGFAGPGLKEKGGEGFKIRFEMMLPDDVRGGAAGDGFERRPKGA